MSALRVEVWSDVVCPWCRIGLAELVAAIAEFGSPVEVVLRSFELDPHSAAVPTESTVEHLKHKYGIDQQQVEGMLEAVRARGASIGLEFDFERARGGNTFDAHRLLHLAAAHGRQQELSQLLFAANFVEGRAVGDHAELQAIAEQAGLPADDVRDVLASDRFAADVRHEEHQAQAYQITGVPFFVIDGRYGVGGAQPAELLVSALREAAATA